MAEIALEKIGLALEATPGTPESDPDVIVPMAATLTPMAPRYKPEDEQWGVLSQRTRSRNTRRWSTLEGEGGLDAQFAHILFNLGIEAVASPTTRAGATNSRLWEFERQMLGNSLRTATVWSGDPNTQVFRAAYTFLEQLTIAADGKSEDAGTTVSITGVGQFPDMVSAPTYPELDPGGLIVPMDFEVWMDVGEDDIGTTQLIGEVLRVEHVIPTGQTMKFIPTGPGGDRTFTRRGINKTAVVTTVEFEFANTTQYERFADETYVKLRVRHNGAYIEDDSGTSDPIYEYIELDGQGYLEEPGWDTFSESNRTIVLVLEHEYVDAWGTDLIARVNNTVATL